MKAYQKVDSKKGNVATGINEQSNNKLEVSTTNSSIDESSNSDNSAGDELENFEEFKEEVV